MSSTRLATSAIFLAVAIMTACGPRPDVYFRPETSFRPFKTVAVLPFNNYSGKEDAGKQVYNAFLVELLKKPFLKVIEPGEIERAMRDERIRSTDQIDYKTMKTLKEKLGADYLMLGAVNEFDYFRADDREIPRLGFSSRLIDTESGQIVWAVYHSRRGNDRELIFSWGLVSSLNRLTEIAVHDVVKRLKSNG